MMNLYAGVGLRGRGKGIGERAHRKRFNRLRTPGTFYNLSLHIHDSPNLSLQVYSKTLK